MIYGVILACQSCKTALGRLVRVWDFPSRAQVQGCPITQHPHFLPPPSCEPGGISASAQASPLAADIELFESAALWKLLRYRYARQGLFSGEVDGHRVRVLGCDTCHAVD